MTSPLLIAGRARAVLASAALAALACWSAPARAADPPPGGATALPDSRGAFLVDLYEPGALPTYDLLGLATSTVPHHLAPALSVELGYVADLVEIARDGDRRAVEATLVEHRVRADLTLALGLLDRFAIALQLPAVLSQGGSDLALLNRPGESAPAAAIGDLRVTMRAHLVAFAGFGLALAFDLYLPSGDGGAFMSYGDPRARPTLVLDWHAPDGLGVVLNLGWRIVPETHAHNLVLDDGLSWGVGLDLPTPAEPLHVHATVSGTAPFAEARDPSAVGSEHAADTTTPIELDGALCLRLGDFELTLGGGAGLSRGVGAPSWRAFTGLSWSPRRDVVLDADGDGILDRRDTCPYEPEDLDDHQDEDGCPEPDNDGDGVPDVDDGAPDERSGFGACRDAPEDKDGFQDEDGCPDPDNDGDGIPDATDGAAPPDAPAALGACRDRPEDKDGHEDADGCPDPDNDGDGIPDVADGPVAADGFGACRDAPETINDYRDDDGCPDKAPKSVRVTPFKIEILEKVFFQYDNAIIKPESYGVLDEVARVLSEAPELTLVRIEGHTDAHGTVAYNNRLSQQRAEAVRDYLVARGVDPRRLLALGYGKSSPLVTGPRAERPEGRALNRRVDFVIIEVDGQPHSPDKPVIIRRPTHP